MCVHVWTRSREWCGCVYGRGFVSKVVALLVCKPFEHLFGDYKTLGFREVKIRIVACVCVSVCVEG